MAKQCEPFDHTADVGLSARADSLEELFEALAEGLAEVICPRNHVAPEQTVEISVQAEDVEALAVDFLSGVMAAIQTDRFMVGRCRVRTVSQRAVTAELQGQPYDPARHELATEIKAVTYHQLKIAREADQWVGRVILDL